MDAQRLLVQLKIEEGCPPVTYLDTKGILTGGLGHNLEAKPARGFEKVNVPVSAKQAEEWYASDLEEVISGLNKHLPWWKNLDDVRQNALADMTWNMGIGGVLTFKNTLRLIQAGDWFGAAANIKSSQYAREVGRRASRVAGMIAYGTWPPDIPFSPSKGPAA